MTINTTPRSASYAGNGATTLFSVPFQFRAAADLRVIVIDAGGAETIKTLTTHYTVSGGAGSTGSVTMLTAPATGETLLIEGAKAISQPTGYNTQSGRFPDGHPEKALDDLTIVAQELRRDADDTGERALQVPRGETAPPVGSLSGANGKVLAVVDGAIAPIDNDVAGAEHARALAEAAQDAAEAAQDAAESAAAGASADKIATGVYRDESALSAAAADDAREAAEAAQALAETAALTAPKVYADTAAGLGATSDTDTFWVKVTGGIQLYLNDGGSAEALGDPFPEATGAPFSGGEDGDVLGSEGGAARSWIGRDALAAEPVRMIDLTDSADYQLEIGSLTSSLSLRADAAVVGDELVLNFKDPSLNVFLFGPGTDVEAKPGSVIAHGGRLVSTASLANAGLAIIFSASAATPGGSLAQAPTGQGIVWRASGTIAAVNEDLGAAANVRLNGVTGMSAPTWGVGQAPEIILRMNDAGTGGDLALYVDGALQMEGIALTGIAAGSYVHGYARMLAAPGGGEKFAVSRIQRRTRGLPLPKVMYLDSASEVTPRDGSKGAPWNTLAEINLEIARSAERSDITILGKRGTDGIYRGTLPFPKDVRRLRLLAVRGHAFRIFPSVHIAAGAGGWTHVSGAVYKRLTQWGSATGTAAEPLGSLINVSADATQEMGHPDNPVTMTGCELYTRRAINLEAADLAPGDLTMHNSSGSSPGYTLIRCHDDGDPDDKDWEQVIYPVGVSLEGGSDTDWNAARVDIDGVTVENAYNYAWYFKRAMVRAHNIGVRGTTQLFGIELDECDAHIVSPETRSCYADHIHASGGLSSDAGRRLPVLVIENPDCVGGFRSSLDGVADIISNHIRHKLVVTGGRLWGAAKDGISPVWDVEARNVDIRYNAQAGLLLAATENDLELRASVKGCVFAGNEIGVMNNGASQTGCTSTLEVINCIFADNKEVDVQSYSESATNTIATTVWAAKSAGAEPAGGYVKQNPALGATVTIRTTQEFAA